MMQDGLKALNCVQSSYCWFSKHRKRRNGINNSFSSFGFLFPHGQDLLKLALLAGRSRWHDFKICLTYLLGRSFSRFLQKDNQTQAMLLGLERITLEI